MAAVSANVVDKLLHACDNGASTTERGRALEDLLCYLFERMPGVSVVKRNVLNVFQSEEIDIAIFNEKHRLGLPFLPYLILIECKNWSKALGSEEVAWFDHKLRQRGLSFGLLVAMNGVTGDAAQKTAAHQVLATALTEQRQLVVLTRADLEALTDTRELVTLIKEKLLELAVSGGPFQ
jgi:hypothetical protein